MADLINTQSAKGIRLNNAYYTIEPPDNSVTTNKLADNSIINSKISDNSITAEKLADNSIINNKISDNSITSEKIQDAAVTLTKLAAEVMNTVESKISDRIAEIVANSPEDFDTLKEIADWITTHADSASAMNTAIINETTNRTNADEALSNRILSLESNFELSDDDWAYIIR